MTDKRETVKGKLTLEFDYEDPKQYKEIKRIFTSSDWSSVVWDMDQYLTDLLNHHGHELKPGAFEQVEKLQDYLRECMKDYGLDFTNHF